MEKSLTGSNRETKMGVAILLAIFLAVIVYGFAQDGLSDGAIVVIVCLYLLLIVLGMSGYRGIDVYFDQQHVFLKGPHGIERLSFSSMKRLGYGGTNRNRVNIIGVNFHIMGGYYLEYFDAASETSAFIHFTSFGLTDDMKEFARLAKEANPRFVTYF
ncbi:MAG: hypothetical protein HYZ44_17050 [Bacteroidetes bacterium]|nr:hypothetical protein [Bacteroidota bacterium]